MGVRGRADPGLVADLAITASCGQRMVDIELARRNRGETAASRASTITLIVCSERVLLLPVAPILGDSPQNDVLIGNLEA